MPIEVQTLHTIALVVAGMGAIAMVVILHRLVAQGQAAADGSREPQPAPAAPQTDLLSLAFDAMPQPMELRGAEGEILIANAARRRLTDDSETGEAIVWQDIDLVTSRGALVVRIGRREADAKIAALEEARARAVAANEAKSRFLATVSHEFRTPLNGVLGMTRLLMETGLDAEQTTYAHAIRSSAEAFLSLVNDMLDMASIEAGRIALSEEPFDLVTLTEGVAELLAPRAQGKGIEIASYIGPGVPRMVRGDCDRLRQILLNLAGNAVKFTRTGGAGIRIERGASGHVAFCIEDTGPGIAPDKAATIFEEFEQVEGAGDGESGTGLGLAIAQRLVERMGGRIVLYSAPGRGARFRFELPLPASGDDSAADDRPGDPAPRALILSRSAFEAEYLSRTIADARGSARIARSLGEAVDAMGQNAFDVLLADHSLPDGDIAVAVGEARRRGLSRTVIMLSPFERHDLGSPHAGDFDGYLIKPVRARSLLQQIADGPRATSLRQTQESTAAARPVGLRILLVEDNEINALLALKTLEKLGAIVEWSRNGTGALARLEATLRGEDAPIDLVLMDLRMPDLDGREVTRRVRQEEARLGIATPLHIVALTASVVGNPEDVIREGGFDGLLTKPFGVEALAAEIEGARLREAV